MTSWHPTASAIALTALQLSFIAAARADAPVPPWVDSEEVPVPSWARSVIPKPGARGETGNIEVFMGPNGASGRRGVTLRGASLPMFGAKRGSGCTGAWWLVGPLGWACSDFALFSHDDPFVPEGTPTANGLNREYYFVRASGTHSYETLDAAEEGSAEGELEAGWGVAVVDQRTAGGERWGRTTKSAWIALRDLVPARASTFRGELLEPGRLDVAWVRTDRASVWSSPPAPPSKKDAPRVVLPRFRLVHVLEDAGRLVRIGADEWVLAADLSRPALSSPPSDVIGPKTRWIDIDLATQTLVAYRGERPVYATIVSTGRGSAAARQSAPDEAGGATTTATPRGVHHIWVKLLGSDMNNVGRDDLDAHYSLEAVPFVQFFDGAVALHGTYWHADFGREHSHGCVNLAPRDAQWLFEFTGPRLPTGWEATYPTAVDEGTVVRVR